MTTEFISICQLAKELDCDAKMLLDTINNSNTDLYAIPNNWHAYLWEFKLNETQLDNTDFIETLSFNESYFTKTESSPTLIQNPIKISTSEILAISSYGEVSVSVFSANNYIDAPEELICKFKLCDPENHTLNFAALLNFKNIAIRNDKAKLDEITKVIELYENKPKFKDSEKEKLQRIIGALAELYSETAPKYKHNNKPNADTISDAILDILNTKQISTSGIGKTILKSNISESVKVLRGS